MDSKKKSSWKKKSICLARDERGMILVIALLLLVVLSIMSVAAIYISNNEQGIAANHQVIQHNFYALEAVAVEACMEIDNLDDDDLNGTNTLAWVKPDFDPAQPGKHLLNPSPQLDMSQSSNWPSGQITPVDTSLNGGVADIVPPGSTSPDRIQYAVIDMGVLGSGGGGSSMTGGTTGFSGSATQLTHQYAVYAMYDVNPGTGKAYPGRLLMSIGHKRKVSHP